MHTQRDTHTPRIHTLACIGPGEHTDMGIDSNIDHDQKRRLGTNFVPKQADRDAQKAAQAIQ